MSGGNIQQEGIPEVCVNGVWGSICDSGWSTTDGHVICKQFGYDDIGIIINSINLGLIWMIQIFKFGNYCL